MLHPKAAEPTIANRTTKLLKLTSEIEPCLPPNCPCAPVRVLQIVS